MRHKSLSILLLLLILVVSLLGCAGPDRNVATSAPVATATPRASATATPPPSPATATPVPPAPTLTPAPNQDTSIPAAPPTSTPIPVPTSTATPPAAGHDPAAVEVELQQIAGGLDTPVGIANAGDGSGRLFILEKVGRIRVVQAGRLEPTPFLDISDRVGSTGNEQGLLGLAFHPRYAENGFFFVNYTDRRGDTVIARFSVGADPARADPGSEMVVLTVDQPASNHNGGHLAFGPDGSLYIGLGDGGGAGDRYGNAQNTQTLLGDMLRIDVDHAQPYAIPGDNPYAGNSNARPELWAIGLRNPWRYSFDRLTGDLYIADVGQNLYEEVNVQPDGDPGGQNYGWPIMEGLHCFPADQPCDGTGLVLPVWEYDHTQGCSVTGGYVYRGREFPFLVGIYLFGDYCSGRIWGLARAGGGAPDSWRVAQVAQADVRLSAFGEDEAGELYLLDMERGELFKITARLK